ncbi:unnamed protein product [Polarella glacialis]|uniref:Uncharacterized protein n=1 Tax=Polarella glacialis TaxID=89957 RepID=A0A813EQ45_POLGL|nr:unnamed protein product [Polarella glacialis]
MSVPGAFSAHRTFHRQGAPQLSRRACSVSRDNNINNNNNNNINNKINNNINNSTTKSSTKSSSYLTGPPRQRAKSASPSRGARSIERRAEDLSEDAQGSKGGREQQQQQERQEQQQQQQQGRARPAAVLEFCARCCGEAAHRRTLRALQSPGFPGLGAAAAEDIHAALRQTGVLGLSSWNPWEWDWPLIKMLVEGPLRQPSKLAEAHGTKFFKRLLRSFSPRSWPSSPAPACQLEHLVAVSLGVQVLSLALTQREAPAVAASKFGADLVEALTSASRKRSQSSDFDDRCRSKSSESSAMVGRERFLSVQNSVHSDSADREPVGGGSGWSAPHRVLMMLPRHGPQLLRFGPAREFAALVGLLSSSACGVSCLAQEGFYPAAKSLCCVSGSDQVLCALLPQLHYGFQPNREVLETALAEGSPALQRVAVCFLGLMLESGPFVPRAPVELVVRPDLGGGDNAMPGAGDDVQRISKHEERELPRPSSMLSLRSASSMSVAAVTVSSSRDGRSRCGSFTLVPELHPSRPAAAAETDVPPKLGPEPIEAEDGALKVDKVRSGGNRWRWVVSQLAAALQSSDGSAAVSAARVLWRFCQIPEAAAALPMYFPSEPERQERWPPWLRMLLLQSEKGFEVLQSSGLLEGDVEIGLSPRCHIAYAESMSALLGFALSPPDNPNDAGGLFSVPPRRRFTTSANEKASLGGFSLVEPLAEFPEGRPGEFLGPAETEESKDRDQGAEDEDMEQELEEDVVLRGNSWLSCVPWQVVLRLRRAPALGRAARKEPEDEGLGEAEEEYSEDDDEELVFDAVVERAPPHELCRRMAASATVSPAAVEPPPPATELHVTARCEVPLWGAGSGPLGRRQIVLRAGLRIAGSWAGNQELVGLLPCQEVVGQDEDDACSSDGFTSCVVLGRDWPRATRLKRLQLGFGSEDVRGSAYELQLAPRAAVWGFTALAAGDCRLVSVSWPLHPASDVSPPFAATPPLHFCTCLASTPPGANLIRRAHLVRNWLRPTLLGASAASPLEVRAALWVAGSLGRVAFGLELLMEHGVLEAIINIATSSDGRWSLCGTACYCLALIGSNLAAHGPLQELGWDSVARTPFPPLPSCVSPAATLGVSPAAPGAWDELSEQRDCGGSRDAAAAAAPPHAAFGGAHRKALAELSSLHNTVVRWRARGALIEQREKDGAVFLSVPLWWQAQRRIAGAAVSAALPYRFSLEVRCFAQQLFAGALSSREALQLLDGLPL